MKPKILGVALQNKQTNKQTKKGISEVYNQLNNHTRRRQIASNYSFSKGPVNFLLYHFQNYWNSDIEYQHEKHKTTFPGRNVTGTVEKRTPGLS